MKKYSHIYVGLLFAAVVALAAWQGHRISHLRESEMFFRWIIGEATRARMFADTETLAQSADEKEFMDKALIQRIADKTDQYLRDVPISEDFTEEEKQVLPRLVLVAATESQESLVWNFARGDVLAPEREDFLQYLRDKKLSSVASEFDTAAIYAEDGASVNIGNIFLGFRKVAANFVWLQVDKYWHQGLLFRMVPLMNTCVTLDPTFVDAYLLGAWHLAYNIPAKVGDTPEALKKYHPRYDARLGDRELYYYQGTDFLKDGIRKNPRDYRLYFDLGYGIYDLKLSDHANAVKYLSEALRNRHDKWVPRMLYRNLELNGQYEQALQGWRDYAKDNPENETAPRFIIRNRGLIKDREADEAFERAQQAQTPEEAESVREQAYALMDEAIAVWEELGGPDGENDPYAAGRIMRIEAIKMLQEERYLEAIAVLEHARWTSNDFFEEATDMIMQAKLDADIPLSLSERMAIARREEAARFLENDRAQARAQAQTE